MRQIFLYVAIMSFGAILAKKKMIPQSIKKRLGTFQSISLFILLGTMGYKIGIDDSLLANFKIIGKQSVIFALCTAGGSVLFTYLCFMGIKTLSSKNKEGVK
ncbi:MAG: LysO family transporter [Fusobacterium sp.]